MGSTDDPSVLARQSAPQVEMVDVQGTILREIADPAMKRADVALTYAFGLVSAERSTMDWPAINRAIIDRWSLSALKWIKERAWNLVEERRRV